MSQIKTEFFSIIYILSIVLFPFLTNCSDSSRIDLTPLDELLHQEENDEDEEFQECLCDACAEFEGLYCEIECNE